MKVYLKGLSYEMDKVRGSFILHRNKQINSG